MLNQVSEINLKLYANPSKSNLKGSSIFSTRLGIAIGNFDGLHLGHRYIMQKLITLLDESSKSMIITFESHSNSIFSLDQKIEAIFNLGIDYILILPSSIKQLNVTQFCQLLKTFNIERIILGQNFRFAHNRQGGPSDLKRHFTVSVVPFIKDPCGQIISSSRIRSFVKAFNIEQSRTLLGYTPYIQGNLICGVQHARTLGFPTININYPSVLYDKGVYLGVVKNQPSYTKYIKVSSKTLDPVFPSSSIKIDRFESETDSLYLKQPVSNYSSLLYPAIIHVGTRPTLNYLNKSESNVIGNSLRVIEAHIVGSSLDHNLKKLNISATNTTCSSNNLNDLSTKNSDSNLSGVSCFYILKFLAKEKTFDSKEKLKQAIASYKKSSINFFGLDS